MQVGEFKAHFSEVVERVKNGEEIVISYGRKRENVAVLIPYAAYKRSNAIALGILKGKARVEFAEEFEITAEELLGE